MTHNHEVRALLDKLADHAPGPDDAIAAHRLIPRIRRRRRTRAVTTSVVPVVAAVAIGGLVATLSSGGPSGPSSPSGPSGTGPSGAGTTASGGQPPGRPTPLGPCAGPVASPGSVGTPGDGALAATTDLPATTSAAGPLTTTVRVANHGRQPVRGFTVTPAQLILVRDGVIVSAPDGGRDVAARIDLAPGASVDLPVTLVLQPCDSTAMAPDAPDKTPVDAPQAAGLPPGSYQAYAVLTVQPVDEQGQAGAAIEVRGGPWDITLR